MIRRLPAAALLFGLAGCRSSADPVVAPAPPPEEASCSEEAARALFDRRIAPLLRQDRPSSCNGCHMVEIELSAFVRGSGCQSMACLLERGLVDFGDPARSHILELIDRGRGDEDPQTRRIAEVEYDAFEAWIAFSARCNDAVCGAFDDPCGPPTDARVADAAVADGGAPDGALPDAAIDLDGRAPDGPRPDAATDGPAPDGPVPDMYVEPGPCDERRLQALFHTRVWRWEGRCHHCHSGDGVEAGVAGAPTWMSDKAGREGADETLGRVVARALLDTDDPSQSLLLLKPLTRSAGGVRHGGGTKFRDLEDPAYIDFRWWITYYAQCTNPALDGGLPDLEVDAAPEDASIDAQGEP